MLRPGSGGGRMPNQLSLVEQRIVAFALGHPGLGPRRVAAGWPRVGRLIVSPNGVYKTLPARLNTAKRLALSPAPRPV